MDKNKELENLYNHYQIQIKINMKDNFQKIKKMDLVYINKMEINMLVNLNKIKEMELVK